MRLADGKRRKIQQTHLAFASEGRGEAPTAGEEGTEPAAAEHEPESPAFTTR